MTSLINEHYITNNIQIINKWDITIDDLTDNIDCGLIWRSTAGMELILKNIPVIIAGVPYYDIILKKEQISSKKEYFSKIENFKNRCN